MEALATSGRVYLSEYTAMLVRTAARLRDLGLFRIKGTQLPMRVYELLGLDAGGDSHPRGTKSRNNHTGPTNRKEWR